MKRLSAYILILIAFSFTNGCVSMLISKTPLSSAAAKGDINTVKDLLSKGANACEKGEYGLTPYMWAFSGEDAQGSNTCRDETYRILMENAYEIFNKGGQCPLLLFYAAGGGCNDLVRKLLEKGYDRNEKYGSFTALSFAVYNGQIDTAKILFNQGADLDSAVYGLKETASKQLPYLSYPANRKTYDKANLGVEMLNRLKPKQVEHKTHIATETTSGTVQEKTIVKSDIDEPPLIKAKSNKNFYAIVIGIENYRQKLPKADFAVSDAKLVSEYLTKALGYPEENVVTLLNDRALQSDMTKYFEKWLANNVEKDSTVFIYYSGHGAPNPKTGDAFLVPYDGDPSFIDQTGYSLKRLYENLNKLQAKEIVVALDSCFSGAGGRSVLAKGARPLVMNMEQTMITGNKIAVLSAAQGDQISSTYDEKGHGLFTYFMLKGIKEGNTALGDLFNYLKPNVEKIARKLYNNEQTPQLIAPEAAGKSILLQK